MSTHRYLVAGDDGGEYSADAADYWMARDSAHLNGALIRTDHPYRTTSGRIVRGARLLRSDATVRDLRRIAGPTGWAGR